MSIRLLSLHFLQGAFRLPPLTLQLLEIEGISLRFLVAIDIAIVQLVNSVTKGLKSLANTKRSQRNGCCGNRFANPVAIEMLYSGDNTTLKHRNVWCPTRTMEALRSSLPRRLSSGSLSLPFRTRGHSLKVLARYRVKVALRHTYVSVFM